VTSMLFAVISRRISRKTVQNLFGIEGFKLEDHIDKVVIVIVFLSILPMIFGTINRERKLTDTNWSAEM